MDYENEISDLNEKFLVIRQEQQKQLDNVYIAKESNQARQEIFYLYKLTEQLSIFSLPIQNLKRIGLKNNISSQRFKQYYLRKLNQYLVSIYGQDKNEFIMRKIYTKNIRQEQIKYYNQHIKNKSSSQSKICQSKDMETRKSKKPKEFDQLLQRVQNNLVFAQDRFQRLIFRARQFQSSIFSICPIPNKSWRDNQFRDPLVLTKAIYHLPFCENFISQGYQLENQDQDRSKIINLEKFKASDMNKRVFHMKFLTEICQQMLQYQFLTNRKYERLQKFNVFYSQYNDHFFLQAKYIFLEAIQYKGKENILSESNGGRLLLLLHYLQNEKEVSIQQLSQKVSDPIYWLQVLYQIKKNQIKKQLQDLEEINLENIVDEKVPICKILLLLCFETEQESQDGFRAKDNLRFPLTILDIIDKLKLKSRVSNLSSGKFEELIYLRWRMINKLLDMNKNSLKIVDKIGEKFKDLQFKKINKKKLDQIKKQMEVTRVFLQILFWVASLQLKSIIQDYDEDQVKKIKLDESLKQFIKQDRFREMNQQLKTLGEEGLPNYAALLIKKLQYITHQYQNKVQGDRDEKTAVIYSLVLKRLLLNNHEYLYSKINQDLYQQLSKKYKKNFFRFLFKLSRLIISLLLCLKTENLYWSQHIAYIKLKKFMSSTNENVEELQELEKQIQEKLNHDQENKRYEDALVWGDLWLQGNSLSVLNHFDI